MLTSVPRLAARTGGQRGHADQTPLALGIGHALSVGQGVVQTFVVRHDLAGGNFTQGGNHFLVARFQQGFIPFAVLVYAFDGICTSKKRLSTRS